MDTFILPPSPNWQLSKVLGCNDEGLLAYASKFDVSVVNVNSSGRFDVSFLNLAHKDKINVVVFSPIKGSFKNCLATCGDDGMVEVWDFKEPRFLYCHSGNKDGVKVMGLDWSCADSNRLVSVTDLGIIVCWDLASNTIRRLHCGIKVLPLCLACCPHDKDLIAIGCRGGVTLIIDIKGTGKIIHRLRGHEQDVISISWCPVPYNVIKHKRNINGGKSEEKERDLLLATGGLEKSIFIWRAGSDGRYQVVLNLPNTNLTNGPQRKKGYMGANTTSVWTCVHWVDAYTLLSSGQFGELLSWDLNKVYTNDKSNNKKPQPRLLHSKHNKGCFSIACPVVHDVVDDWRTESRTVWSTAMDKHLVACSLTSGNIVLDITTLGGGVFSMALSPLDPNRLAIGSSDNKVFVWNMSDLSNLNITTYWKKIIGKVMAVCWHPTEENWLAYGTSDGHVGLIDVGSNKIPTLFRLHHRKAVYRVCWAPTVLKYDDRASGSDSQLVLYSVGDGDVFQYTANPLEPNEEPKSLNSAIFNKMDLNLGLKKPLMRSDVVFKPDLACFALGNDNGSVYIVSFKLLTLLHVLYPHKKLMNNLEWHPETVASDNNVSPYKDWLATTCDNIIVYNIPSEGQPELVAKLSGHYEKIVGLAWSPHFNGRLLSASYDSTVQVWDVVKQSCLGVFQGHCMAVLCSLFSPQNPDTVISGSQDSSVRLWSISKEADPLAKPDKKNDRLKNLLKKRSKVEEATELTIGVSDITINEDRAVTNERHSSSINTSPNSIKSCPATDKGTEDYRKRQKIRAVFTVTGSKLAQAKHFDILLQRNTATPPPPDEEGPSASDLGYLDFFGDDKAMRRLLMVEESQLTETKQHLLAQQSALWRGDVSQMIKEAITKKQLTDWLVSIAPLAGFEAWEEACSAFADQLVECGEVSKACTYLLAIHKVHEAVQLLADYKLYREAAAIAKCRLSPEDPLIIQVYTEWGHTAKLQGSLALAAHCYLAANDTQACIETLARIKELKSLKMAALLAQHVGHVELADSLAVECLTMCVVASNYTVAYQLIAEMSQYQYWSVWLRTSELLTKVKNRSEVEVFEWLEGLQQGQLSLSHELATACSSTGQVYQKLLPQLPTNRTPEFERDMWFYVSGQLAAAYAARSDATSAHFLRHMILALSAAFHFQTSHPNSLALPLTVSVIVPTGLFAKESILTAEYKTTEEKNLIKSLKAFVCASIVHWMNNNWEKVASLLSKGEQTLVETKDGEKRKYKMSWLPELLKNCSGDVLDADNVSFFVKKAQKEDLQNVVTKENILKKRVENKVEGNNKGKQRLSKSKTEPVIGKTGSEKVGGKSAQGKKVIIKKSDTEETKKVEENLSVTTEIEGICESADKTKSLKAHNFLKNYSSIDVLKSLKAQDNIDNYNSTGVEKTVYNPDKIEHLEVNAAPPNVNNTYDKAPNASTNGVTTCSKDSQISKDKTDSVAEKDENKKPTKSDEDFNGSTVSAIDSSRQKTTDLVDHSNLSDVDARMKNHDKSDKIAVVNMSGDMLISNGSNSFEESEEGLSSKLKEIEELDKALQKFEVDRVIVPSPFTAYINIKYLIDNIVSKQDSILAQKLQEDCNQLWKKSHQ